MLEGARILLTGPTGQAALPVAHALARRNRVFGLARLRRPEDRARLERAGVVPVPCDLAADPLDAVPTDVDYVLHFAVVRSGDFDYDLAANAEGVGRLLAHCAAARAFLHVSTTAVYEYAGHTRLAEDAPLGDNHRTMMPTYSLCKIAAEAVVRFAARQWNVPTTIARLSVPYGSTGGWPWYHLKMMQKGIPIPVHPERPNLFNPIHEQDYIAMLPKLLEVAAVPATLVNWGGEEVALEDWCRHLGELTGTEPVFEASEQALGSVAIDRARLHRLVGEARVPWRDGLRRMVEALEPGLLRR